MGETAAGIPGADEHNPGRIADDMSDKTGKTMEAGAYVLGAIGATLEVARTAPALVFSRTAAVALPLLTVAVGPITSLMGVGLTKALERSHSTSARRDAVLVAVGLFLIAMYFVVKTMGITFASPSSGRLYTTAGPWIAIMSGTIVGVAFALVAEYYTGFPPARRMASARRIVRIAVGVETATIPLLLTGVGIFISYRFSGLYGIGISAVGMLATVGMTMLISA